ncbi:mRNA-decapping enzyme subunit 2 [Physcomitrium patens]|uniref:Nudix hydrolase domain-containing protein n=1 Tax=Physcomitrium patens TaxID=3218 RepID=A0A2K1L1U6_PHYPA|nr:mRNA-decapping enzyme subunit 2-like [Physcomitrium patens]PNR60004.1 hypothetical protein PHYPA_002796 [Physcomitrium patens]|eukprot:XP_024400126.1 mRNA-decapping enzyme subunit 2-like [Physcomitrella patens]
MRGGMPIPRSGRTGGGVGNGGPPQRTQLPSRELLDDLCSRFVLNMPEEELKSFERILFSIEQAHWFYEDNAMEQNMALKAMTLREFSSLMFQSCAALRPYLTQIDNIYRDFTMYKTRVPVTGAIILDESLERCLLVKGWKAGASWSFPRGKKNKDEEDSTCAVREVVEETSYNIKPKLNLDDHLEVVVGQQRMRLFIIPGVKDDFLFEPQTKKEVSEIAWHRLDELPVSNGESVLHHRGPTGFKYFMVFPFIVPLKLWISKRRLQYPKRVNPVPTVSVWKVKNNSSGGGFGPLSQNYVSAVMPVFPAAVAAPVPLPEKIKSSPRSTPETSPMSTPKTSPISTPRSSPRSTPKNSPRSTLPTVLKATSGITPKLIPPMVPKTPPSIPPKTVLKGPPGNAFRNFRFDFAQILKQLDG